MRDYEKEKGSKMVNINGKRWNELTDEDIKSAILDNDESFFFEYKEDDVQPKKIVEEISAFANTYGGYIFIGVADNKDITGCTEWNEQRIHITIHDSISPIPSFDVKKFDFSENKIVLVIKVDEGVEPPYMTNKGMIYERLSSGSFVIKDSSKLMQMFYKNESQIKKIEQKLGIPFISEKIGNVYGYIDVGFELKTSDTEAIYKKFREFSISQYLKQQVQKGKPVRHRITRCGNTIILNIEGLSSDRGVMPAHVNTFAEYMIDGSVKFRTLIVKNTPQEGNVNMMYNLLTARQFEDFYKVIFGDILAEVFTGAKKYESLICIEQFYPRLYFGEYVAEEDSYFKEKDQKIQKLIMENSQYANKDIVLTNNRIPKNGFYNIERSQFDQEDYPMTLDNLVAELFESGFFRLGMVPGQQYV